MIPQAVTQHPSFAQQNPSRLVKPVRCGDQSQISFKTFVLQFFFLSSTSFVFPIIRVLTPFSSIFRLEIKQARHLLWYFSNNFNDLRISRGKGEEGNENSDKARKMTLFL